MRLLGCVSRSPRWSATLGAPVDASRLSEPEGRLSVCGLLTRRGRTPLVLASCAVSRFRETNHEFVQSNEWEGIRGDDGNCRVCGREVGTFSSVMEEFLPTVDFVL